MKILRSFWGWGAVLLWVGAAGAMDGPSVKVVYSLDTADGGRLDYRVTGTALGMGDVEFVVTEEDDVGGMGGDESTEADVFDASPLEMVIGYSADPETHEIIDGPVELSDLHWFTYFSVFPEGLSTWAPTLQSTLITGVGHGTLAGDTITWSADEALQYQTTVAGIADCLGDEILCTIAAVNDPWPRLDDPTPRNDLCDPLPTFTLSSEGGKRATGFVSDNGTPLPAWTDDICSYSDEQVTMLNTWAGAEVSRLYVPVAEPSGPLLRTSGLLAVTALRRRASRRARRHVA